MISSSPKKPSVSSKNILILAAVFFVIALLFLFLKSKPGFGLDQKITQVKRLPILISVMAEDDVYLFGLYAEFYPLEKKAALFFINPKTSIEDSEKTLIDKGSSAPSYIESILEDTLDQPIPYRIILTKKQLAHWINLMGGIELFFEPRSGHITTNYHRNKTIYTLDGEDCLDWMTALPDEKMISYIRRLEVQETVILSLFESIHFQKENLNKQQLSFLHSQWNTNLSAKEWDTILDFLKKDRTHYSVSELPGEPVLRQKKKDEILKSKKETIKVAFYKFSQDLRSQASKEGERARIEVLNGTAKNGLARYGKVLLNDKGLKVLTVDNAWDHNFKASIILNRSGNTQYTDSISETFQDRKVYFALRKDLGLDATVILGEDFQSSKD
ncbi:LytR C-terminal domain-containing protein [Leptospira sp. 96542]|nr:LytR C-terminal domain-containing protein [Leptospira sp. 96542]